MNQYESHPEATDDQDCTTQILPTTRTTRIPTLTTRIPTTFTTYIGKRHTCTGAFSELQRLPMTHQGSFNYLLNQQPRQVGGLLELDSEVMARWKFHLAKKKIWPENGQICVGFPIAMNIRSCNQWNAPVKCPNFAMNNHTACIWNKGVIGNSHHRKLT